MEKFKYICDLPEKENGRYGKNAFETVMYSPETHEMIVKYMNTHNEPYISSSEKVIDPFTGEEKDMYDHLYTDGEWIWSAMIKYCFENDNIVMKLNKDFIIHVILCYKKFAVDPPKYVDGKKDYLSLFYHPLRVETKEKILEFFNSFPKPNAYTTSFVTDLVTGQEIENLYDNGFTDGVYEWNSAWVYYFEKYDMKLNDDFIKYVLEKNY